MTNQSRDCVFFSLGSAVCAFHMVKSPLDPTMSSFSNVLLSGGLRSVEPGRRGHYEQLDNGYNGVHATRFQQFGRYRRISLSTLFLFGILIIAIYITGWREIRHLGTAAQCKWALSNMSPPNSDRAFTMYYNEYNESTWAQVMTPRELMARLDDGAMHTRILHQSWKDEHLPERFAKWSEQWRSQHGSDWA